jgi:signal transduction histidine kinase
VSELLQRRRERRPRQQFGSNTSFLTREGLRPLKLVSIALELAAIEADAPTGNELGEQLAHVTEHVDSALDDLVEIARGIHPAILSQGGLAPALNSLARRFVVPVELHAPIDDPLPHEVEVAAYYIAAEALTNVAKHARASVVHMDAATDDGP